MTYHLSLNGTSDYLKTPTTITYNKIVIDAVLYTEPADSAYHYTVDSTSRSTGGYLRFMNGTQYTNFTISPTITKGTRSTNNLTIASATTGGLTFGSAYSTGNYFQMDIYSITIYNGATVVASYNMTLGNQVSGTVQDQSGNGNHATLTGGTWIQDSSQLILNKLSRGSHYKKSRANLHSTSTSYQY